MNRNTVVGQTLRFTFDDGPMAGKSIEHSFDKSGSLSFRPMGGKGDGSTVKKYETATVGPDVCAVSYLGDSGYTLTVVLDYRTNKLIAFSSNDKMHMMHHGTFEPVKRPHTGTRKTNGGEHAASHR